MIVTEVARGRAALASLRDEWRRLFDRSAAAPFLRWEWLDAWSEHLGEGRVPHILCARDQGELVGLLPLCEDRPVPLVRRLSFLGERFAGADYLDVLAVGGREDEIGRHLVGSLLSGGGFDVLDLDNVAADSQLLGLVQGRVTPRYTCPQVALDGPWRDVLKRSKRADNFKRRLRQLIAMEGFERRVVREPGEVGAAFERFLSLHEKRWEGQGGSDAMGRPAIQGFHRDVVVRLAQTGVIRFEELWVEGDCRASIYGIDGGATYYFYQSGYDPAWARTSVGLVNLGLSIEEAIGRGAKVYDFLRGTEPYKFDWATGSRETVAVRQIARSVGSVLLLAREGAELAARTAAHRLLPGGAVELLRRLRRTRDRMGD